MLQIDDAATLPVSLAELKAYLRIDFNDDDVLLARCLRSATNWLEHETERDIATRNWTKVFPCFSSRIILDRSPLLSVGSIEFWDNNNQQQTLTDYRVEGSTFRNPVIVIDEPPQTATRSDAVTISYTTGMPSSPLVEQAILWASVLFFEHREPEIIGTISSPLKLGLDRLIVNLKSGGYA